MGNNDLRAALKRAVPYLSCYRARHWSYRTSHTVWGRIADEASFDVIEKIVQKPTTAPPGGMHMLDEHVAYTRVLDAKSIYLGHYPPNSNSTEPQAGLQIQFVPVTMGLLCWFFYMHAAELEL
eukprot:1139936-Pelagomonas_calceolata.AAC.2